MFKMSATRSASSRSSDRTSDPITQRKKLGNVRGGKWSNPHATTDAVRGPDGVVLTIVHSQASDLRRDGAGRHGGVAGVRSPARRASASPTHDGAAPVGFAGICGRTGAAGRSVRMDARTILRAARSPFRGDGDITTVAISRMSLARSAARPILPRRCCHRGSVRSMSAW
jgi:hypothetical protein